VKNKKKKKRKKEKKKIPKKRLTGPLREILKRSRDRTIKNIEKKKILKYIIKLRKKGNRLILFICLILLIVDIGQ